MRTWLITGASRGLGAEIAKAALAAGDRVIATARRRAAITEAFGDDTDSLCGIELDVTDAEQVHGAVASGHARFGDLDILVNNAGYGQLGFFEENAPEDARAQMETNFLGVLNVTWAVLPLMRAVRRGHIFNISSTAGLRGSATGSIYCASKFAVEGFSEALALEISSFGIAVTIVEPGLFRTGFLDDASVRFGEGSIPDYEAQSKRLQARYRSLAGKQTGDPRRLAQALVLLADEPKPPLHFAAGSDAVATVEGKISALAEDLNRWRELSESMDSD